MPSTNEPMAMPDEIIEPAASYEVVQESYQGPRASFEPLQAHSSPRISTDSIQLSVGSQPSPTSDYEQRGINEAKNS